MSSGCDGSLACHNGGIQIRDINVLKKILIGALGLSLACNAALLFWPSKIDPKPERPSDMRIFQNSMMFFKQVNSDAADGEYIIFGDSLVQGMSPYLFDFSYVNMGVGGYTVKWINALLNKTNVNKYKAVVIEGGTNDALSRLELEDAKSDLKKLFATASKAKSFYYLQIPPMVEKMRKGGNARINELNAFTSSLCSTYSNCTIVPAPKNINEKCFYEDGIHLSKCGYDTWVKEIKAKVK